MSFQKTVLCIFSVAVPVLLFELGLRVAREKMDYLAPERVADPALGFRVVPFTGGHDEWGFRNLEVPVSTEVVALGDSNTWGVAARWDESWPSEFARKTGQRVYNLGMGGYGPVEYFHLLETKALSLNPDLVVVALFLGNDFFEAYRSVSDRRHWASFRTRSMAPIGGQEEPTDFYSGAPFVDPRDAEKNPIKRIRNWLRGHSMLFRIIEEGPLGQRVNAWGDQQEEFGGSRCAFQVEVPFSTVVNPELFGLDLADPKIEEGIELSLFFLEKIARVVEAHGSELLVVLIPTKESVMASKTPDVSTRCEGILRKVLTNEEAIRERVRAFLDEQRIPFVDTFEALREHALGHRIYLQSGDSHPNGEGYAVIAKEVAAATANHGSPRRAARSEVR